MRHRRCNYVVTAVSAAVLCVSGAGRAGTVSSSPTAPTSNILTSQLVDLGTLDPAAQDGSRDYTDNSGPVAETFHLGTAANVTAITVKGNGDSSSDPNVFFHFQVGTFNTTTGQITQLRAETAPEVSIDNDPNFLTLTFATPVAVPAGSNLEFSIYSETAGGGNWFGLSHSTAGTHPGDGGSAFNYDTSTTSSGNNQDGIGKNLGWANPGFVALNPGNYEYVFAVQGTAVPEPASACLLGIGAAGLLVRRRGQCR